MAFVGVISDQYLTGAKVWQPAEIAGATEVAVAARHVIAVDGQVGVLIFGTSVRFSFAKD